MANFGDLVNIEEFDKREYFSEERGDISFYCRDCKSIVEVDRPDEDKYIFICKKCESKRIAIGTLEGLKSNYKIKS